ncbi:facilitated trehalose transporter Tret1 isoform X1 [Manduca sexta]|uniref:facilitated trehalose transporter Tret1 isoform X1 n=2 Tax=Manduca sexta TaxID=7130 RepID=UPI00188FE190|nr:facilitated trehalose transporter Tret1 isoform X1 [Manduca sexta]
MTKIVQVACTGIVCCLCLSMGVMFSWPSSTLRLFESRNTTLHRPMTEGELALFGSLSSIGALISTPVAGMFLDRLGRKYSAIVFGLMAVLSWVMIISCNRVEVLLTAIFVSGLSGAVFLVVPVFVSEICEESIRGAMTSGTMIFYGIGMLISYLLGGLLEYHTMTYVCLTMSVMVTVMLSFLKESAPCLLAKGMEEEAKKSIAFYTQAKIDSKEVMEEMNILRRALQADLDTPDATPEEEKLKPLDKPKEKLSTYQFIKRSRSTRQALLMCFVIMTAAIFQGLVVIQVYAEPLFEEAIPNMSATVCSVLMAVVTIVAGLLAAYLTEVAGRRPLMIYGSIASGLTCVLLGTQIHFHWGPNWVTAVVIYLFAIMYSLGAGTVPYVLAAEVFLPEVKSFVTMLVVEWAWLCNSVILFIFNPLLHAIGLGPVFYIFAVVCFLTALYCIVYMPETKGLAVDAIQTLFIKRRKGREY